MRNDLRADLPFLNGPMAYGGEVEATPTLVRPWRPVGYAFASAREVAAREVAAREWLAEDLRMKAHAAGKFGLLKRVQVYADLWAEAKSDSDPSWVAHHFDADADKKTALKLFGLEYKPKRFRLRKKARWTLHPPVSAAEAKRQALAAELVEWKGETPDEMRERIYKAINGNLSPGCLAFTDKSVRDYAIRANVKLCENQTAGFVGREHAQWWQDDCLSDRCLVLCSVWERWCDVKTVDVPWTSYHMHPDAAYGADESWTGRREDQPVPTRWAFSEDGYKEWIPGWQPPRIVKQYKTPDSYHAYLTKCLERAHMRVYLRELRTGVTQVKELDRESKSYADWKVDGGGQSYDGEERVAALCEKVLDLAGRGRRRNTADERKRDAAILAAILASHSHCKDRESHWDVGRACQLAADAGHRVSRWQLYRWRRKVHTAYQDWEAEEKAEERRRAIERDQREDERLAARSSQWAEERRLAIEQRRRAIEDARREAAELRWLEGVLAAAKNEK